MKQNKNQRREEKKRELEARRLEWQRRKGAQRPAQPKSNFPSLGFIHDLSIGEGSAPGFAYRLARNYLDSGESKLVVAVDLLPAEYQLPENMRHVTGNALEFLASLPKSSVEKVHDYFAAHHIGSGDTSAGAKKAKMSLALDAKSGSSFAGRQLLRQNKSWSERIRQYFSQVSRVLAPGGLMILVSQAAGPAANKKYVQAARKNGLVIKFDGKLSEGQAEHFDSPQVNRLLGQGQALYHLVAWKPG